MRCASCDAELEAGSKFCDACGARQPALASLSTPALKPPAPPLAPATADVPAARPDDLADAMRDLSVLGTSEPNAVYLGQRLQYSEGAETFDVGDQLAGRVFAQIKLLFFVALVLWFLSWLASLILAFGFGKGGVALATLLQIGVFLFNTALLISPLLRHQGFPLSEWKLLLDGKGSSADDVYDHIAAVLVARDAPTQYRAVKLPELWRRGYLQIRMERFSGYVSCFAFGKDLYIGWTLWWSGSWIAYRRENRDGGLLALLTLPWMLVIDMLNGRNHAYELAYVHQFDEAKALRECLHAVTRQGVEAAIGLVPMRGKGTIGSTVPEGPAPKFATSPSFEKTRRRS